MAQALMIDDSAVRRSVDQRIFLHGVSWDGYEAVLAMRGESSAVRIAYLRGELELMSPSRDHEKYKTMIARLLEAYAMELGLELEGYGSWTLKERREEVGAEPDECYSIGVAGRVPDIAIEVVWTSGGLEKLEIYRRLGVREVWVYEDGQITPYLLRATGYEESQRSEVLAEVDLGLIVSLLERPTQSQAVRELQAELRRRRGAGPAT